MATAGRGPAPSYDGAACAVGTAPASGPPAAAASRQSPTSSRPAARVLVVLLVLALVGGWVLDWTETALQVSALLALLLIGVFK